MRCLPRRSLAAALALAAALSCACSPDEPTPEPAATSGNVFAERAQTLVPDPRLVAAAKQATGDGDTTAAAALDRLAAVPTGIWLTPERFDASSVAAYVTGVVSAAAGRTVPLFVIYGIPDRDCTGAFSSGGLTPETYLPWVESIATAASAGGAMSAAVLEPDALAGSLTCGTDDRIPLLRAALDILVAAGVTTYVDAGHSDWVPARRMARLLRQVGVEKSRGFATNVSNYQPEARERAFGATLSALLDDAHYVIDVGRNGDPNGSGRVVRDWCNPPNRALGDQPGFVDDATPLDALLWIKPPSESDGECHGGPPAGAIWLDRAVQLVRAAT